MACGWSVLGVVDLGSGAAEPAGILPSTIACQGRRAGLFITKLAPRGFDCVSIDAVPLPYARNKMCDSNVMSGVPSRFRARLQQSDLFRPSDGRESSHWSPLLDPQRPLAHDRHGPQPVGPADRVVAGSRSTCQGPSALAGPGTAAIDALMSQLPLDTIRM